MNLGPHQPGAPAPEGELAAIAAIAAGDADAFAGWVAGAEPRIRLSLASFAEVVDTEAVLQETLLRVWQVAPRFRPDGRPDGLTRLGVRIARNLALSELRRGRVEPMEAARLQREADAHAEAPPAPDPLMRALLRRCLEALPDSPGRAIRQRLAARGDRPDADLARDAGMRPNTFLQNVRRARLGLERCLARHGVTLAPRSAR